MTRMNGVRGMRESTARTIALAAVMLGAAGCGAPSFFEVTVTVMSGTGVRTDCLAAIGSCEVTVSGAASGSYSLGGHVCDHPDPRSYTLTQFQFGSDSDSGNVTFDMSIFDPNGNKLGQGNTTVAIKSQATLPVTLTITPNLAAFVATGACPQ